MVPIAQLREWLNAEESGAQDDLIRRTEEQVIAMIGGYCNRYFGEPAATTHIRTAPELEVVYLPDPPTGSVVVSTRSGVGDAWVTYSGDVEVNGRAVRCADGLVWSDVANSLKFAYTRGYTETTAPAGLVAVVLDFCRYYYKEGRTVPATLGLDPTKWPIPGAQLALAPFYRPPVASAF